MSKRLPTKTIIERVLGISISSSLPAKDKVAVMEYLLVQSAEEIERIGQCEKATAFVSLCTNLIRQGDLLTYMQILSICREQALNDDKRA